MFGPGSPSGIFPAYAGVLARKHNFAPYAMEFLATAGKSVFMNLVESMRPQRLNHHAKSVSRKFDVWVWEVRPLGRTTKTEEKGPLGPEALGAEAHEGKNLNVGAKAPTS
jgi:hypothetical protein